MPLVLVVALVGGFFVFRSFASVTKPSEYQYSIKTCGPTTRERNASTDCQDKSAEALVYRMQLAAIGRQTDWGYNAWTQKLAGDRSTSLRIAQEIEATAEVRWGNLSNKDYVDKVAGLAKPAQRAEWTKQIDEKKMSRVQLAQNIASLFKISVNKAMMPSYKYNNKQFVEHIFKKLLKRGESYSASPTDYWVKQLDSEKMSRAAVIVTIAKSSEAISKSRADVATYVASKPAVKITQTAKAKQDARNRQLAALVSSSKTHHEKGAQHHQVQASRLPVQASNQASPNAPSRAALTTIANIQRQAEQHRNYAQQSSNNAQNDLKKAETLLKEAKAVAAHSRDIPSATAESSRNKVAMYAAQAKNKVADINRYISQIASSYKTAEKKYQAEQKRLADEAARQPVGGGGGGGNNPCAGVRSSSSRDAIKACQRYLGVTADGIWGPNTERAFTNKFGYGSGYNPGGGPTGDPDDSGDDTPADQPALNKKPTYIYGPCTGGRSPVWHGTYLSCHQGGDTSKQGYFPNSSKLLCTSSGGTTYRKNQHNSDARWPGTNTHRWQGTNCRRN